MLMTISVLADNHPGSHTPAEHGLSYLIEHGGKRVLFDTGQSDMFLRNAEAMKISMTNIDMVILSHGHFDHGNGLGYLSGSTVISHPGCFVKRYRGSDHSFIGLKNSREELSLLFNLISSTEPYKISEKIYFLGEIPRLSGFESQTTSFVFEDGSPDYVKDDSGIVLILPEGLFVVTGCGHSGIVNVLEHAKKITGVSTLYGILGGFHLKDINTQTKETIRYLKENNLKHILPSHCTELPALSAFYDSFGIKLTKTGDVLNF
jgi:7,8-dihydropterin-6-yl-methyl-4-(beta-D-ribofuranosyl)aminobenzene 5'-phosphate synthase